MNGKQIKGLTVEIGGDTAKLGKSLEGVYNKGTALSTELGKINKLLKLDPTNTELLAQKQKVLSDAISTTEEKLRILKEAEQQAQAQFEKGEISAEQYRSLQREVIATETKLKQYKKAAEETAHAAESLGDSADRAADELKEQKEKTSDAERATEDLGDSLGDAAKTGFSALVAAATAAIAAIAALAESTREYRAEMGKLDTAYKTSGHSSQTAAAAYKELQSVIGETDQAVEAAQQIALLADSAEEVAEWSGLAAGLVGRLGDALQPETFYEAANEVLKLGESTSAWTQMLEQTGIMAVEDFNKSLAACATTEEKQAYMLGVAKKALGNAADQYKATNAELIRANKANEEWNATLAEAGEIVEPVVTDVKELGTALLKQAKAPLKEVANYIRNTFLPNLVKVGSWAKQNLPQISALIASVTATLVLHKVAALSAEMAVKGLTLKTMAMEAAQKALNVVLNANPYVLVATSVAAMTAALIALDLSMKPVAERVDVLTAEEEELVTAASAAAEAFRDQQAAIKESMEGTVAEMDHIQSLADELFTLADASGTVQEKDQARANFILGQLNKALGTEYSMVDGVIQKYGELKGSIDEVIKSKLANALLEEAEQGYVQAYKERGDALLALQTAEKAYVAQTEASTQKISEYQAEIERLNGLLHDETKWFSQSEESSMEMRIESLKDLITAEKNAVAGVKATYDQAAADYKGYTNTIITYTQAQQAALEGNYEQTAELLAGESEAYVDYGILLSEETQKQLDTLYNKAVEAGAAAQTTKENFEKGVSGFTQEMVDEAERAYQDALGAFGNAYADAASIGNDIGSGLVGGLENTRPSLISKGISMVKGLLSSMRAAADSHSPARETIDFGEDVGEGTVIGVDNKTKDVARAGERQAEALLDAYRSQEIRGQNTLRGIADRQSAAQVGSYMSAGAQNTGVLNKILTAIEKGQVLVINKDQLVGGTAADYDSALGARQILVERGAL